MQSKLRNSLQFLAGVGPKRAELFSTELGFTEFDHLLYYFPYRYIDRSRFYNISEINEDMPYIQIRGRFTKFTLVG
ncbi:MAG: ATP-dependent DNA helicase RecG, partial [Bacteroidales bacterium]|nr:ATP-dependent DNA helicase RecG [Bacteroidales bacterium]